MRWTGRRPGIRSTDGQRIGMSSRRGRGAGPARGRRARGVEIIQPALNPTARPEKDKKNKKKENKSKKEMEYSLG